MCRNAGMWYRSMRNIKRKRIIPLLIILVCLIIGTVIFVPYQNAKNIAVKSLQTVTIHDQESFQRIKDEIYDIVSPEVRQSLFEKEFPPDRKYPLITYEVNKIRGKRLGLNHYEFIVNWTSNGYLTIDSLISVKDGIVYDSKRVDL